MLSLKKLRFALYTLASLHAYFIPADDKDCPSGDFFSYAAGNSAVSKFATHVMKNILGVLLFPFKNQSTGAKTAVILYGRLSPVGDTDYAASPIGSLYVQKACSSAGVVTDSCYWEKTAAGWEKISRRGRVVFKRYFGDATSRFDITVEDSGTGRVRYTYDGTGTAPGFVANGLQVGDSVVINSTTFTAANNGTFIVTTVAATYFEVVNSAGVAEANKVIEATSIASNPTLTVDETIVLADFSGARTIVLPTAVGCDGLQINIKSLGAGTITLDGYSSETINGAATYALTGAGSFGVFVSDGTNWRILNGTHVISPNLILSADLTITSAQVKALKATPLILVAAPGADLAIVPIAYNLVADYGGTNAFTEAADDLSIGYATGAEITEIESTGFIDQTNDEWRCMTVELAETFIPEENKALVITNLDDEIAGNAGADNRLHVRVFYRIVPTDLA